MSSQQHLPQTLTTMEACFTLHEDTKILEEFWRHQERMGPIAAAAPGFVAVIGGPIARSHWLYFCGKWQSPDLMDQWQFDSKHIPMQTAAHARWFASMYIRKWRLPDAGEPMTGPLFCEIAIARQTPIEASEVDKIMDEIVGPSVQEYGAPPFETLTGAQLGYHAKPIAFLDIASFWTRLEGFLDHAVDAYMLRPEARALVRVAGSANAALDLLQ